jgi:hypothetical protein
MLAVTAAIGARRDDDAMRAIEVALTAGNDALVWACMTGGDALAERIVDLAAAHPGVLLGELLARTPRPEKLIALYAARTDHGAEDEVLTIGELALVHRDAGQPHPEAERAWQRCEAAWTGSKRVPDMLLETRLRMAARRSLDEAIAMILEPRFGHRWEDAAIGALAVIARLVPADPTRAVRLVMGEGRMSSPEPSELVSRVQGLCWWFAMPREAEPVVEAIVGHVSPEQYVPLARWLAGARELTWLDRAIAAAGPQPPELWGRALGREAARLRQGGHDAELLRERAVRLLGDAVAVYDLWSEPALPRLVPWLSGTSLP